MTKRVFLIHGWDGHPNNAWFPWVAEKLKDNGFEVFAPQMPNPEEPEIKSWVQTIAENVENPDENTYFIGHSIGCQAILRYVEKLDTNIGGIVCVAGFFDLPNLNTQEEKDIARPWLTIPIDFAKIKSNCPKIIAIFSDDDPEVELSQKDVFKAKLNAETMVEHKKGHFSDDEEIFELPSVVEAIKKIS